MRVAVLHGKDSENLRNYYNVFTCYRLVIKKVLRIQVPALYPLGIQTMRPILHPPQTLGTIQPPLATQWAFELTSVIPRRETT